MHLVLVRDCMATCDMDTACNCNDVHAQYSTILYFKPYFFKLMITFSIQNQLLLKAYIAFKLLNGSYTSYCQAQYDCTCSLK